MNAYWRNREEQNQREYLLEEDEYVDRLQDILDYTLDQIDREISDFYTRYASKEGITYAEATQRVSQLDMDEYERKAKKYVSEKDFSDKANEEMRLYNLTMKVNRLELLKSNIGLELVNNFMIIDDEMKGYLTERAISEYTRQAGILGMTVKDSARKAEALVNASFRHATFSDRIWMYQSQLKSAIDVLLREGIIQGQGPLELARQLDKLFDTGKYNCERLMRTELTRVQSAAQLDSFITNGFEEYQFNALGDACKICAALDERHFKITDAMPGENLPPIHPNCRCAVSAWMDDALYNQWLSTYRDHGMSYDDWLQNRPLQSDEDSNKIKRDYSCELAQALGKDAYDAICDIADACADDNLRKVWDNYHTKIHVGSTTNKGTAFARGDTIYVNADTMKSGNSYKKPYETLFHEASHAIDYKAGTWGHFSTEDGDEEDSTFLTAIKKDVNSHVNSVGNKMKSLIKSGDWDGLYEMGVTGTSSRDWYEIWGEYPDATTIKYTKSMAYQYVQEEIQKLDPYAQANVSDIYEGATRKKVSAGYGHETSYWKYQENVALEAFAEFCDASFTNPESLEQMKKYLPGAYETWKEAIAYLAD